MGFPTASSLEVGEEYIDCSERLFETQLKYNLYRCVAAVARYLNCDSHIVSSAAQHPIEQAQKQFPSQKSHEGSDQAGTR